MRKTAKQKYKPGWELLEQIALNLPIPTMGEKRVSDLEREELMNMCSMLAGKVLDCVGVMLEGGDDVP